jgi:hypothetical protein
MAFADFTEFLEPLELSYKGKGYVIPPISAKDGLRYSGVIAPDSTDTMTDEEFKRAFLGPAYDDMMADNVPAAMVTRAAMTALAEYQSGRDTAEIMWATGGDPKAIAAWKKAHAPNRASRRSTNTGSVKKTH